MSTLRTPPDGGRKPRTDRIGKQAIFSVPDELIDLAALETPLDLAPDHEIHAVPDLTDTVQAVTTIADDALAAAEGIAPDPAQGPLALECSACGVTTRLGLVDFALAHLPVGIWLPIPGWRFNRYATCPSCRKLTWLRAHFAR